jgi:hypothetical protein
LELLFHNDSSHHPLIIFLSFNNESKKYDGDGIRSKVKIHESVMMATIDIIDDTTKSSMEGPKHLPGDGRVGISVICHRRQEVIDGVVGRLSEFSNQAHPFRQWICCSVEVICEKCFSKCKSLESISFEWDSKLSRIERKAFCESCLESIHLPASVEVICESCFSRCASLKSISFESNSKLSRIERRAYFGSGLTSIHFPASVKVICEECFSNCGSLGSITIEGGAKSCESQFPAAFRPRSADALSRGLDGVSSAIVRAIGIELFHL